jgi:ketosteroid isomerase-like protein
MKWLVRIIGVGLVVFALWQVWQRMFVTDEMRIKRQISAMARAVEKGEILKLSDAIASDYADDHGLDKGTLLAVVRGFRAQSEALFIYISDQKIEAIPSGALEARAVIVAKVLSKTKGGSQTELNADRIRLFFRKTDYGWKLSRTESPELKFE